MYENISDKHIIAQIKIYIFLELNGQVVWTIISFNQLRKLAMSIFCLKFTERGSKCLLNGHGIFMVYLKLYTQLLSSNTFDTILTIAPQMGFKPSTLGLVKNILAQGLWHATAPNVIYRKSNVYILDGLPIRYIPTFKFR